MTVATPKKIETYRNIDYAEFDEKDQSYLTKLCREKRDMDSSI
jgi:hypothetical protein